MTRPELIAILQPLVSAFRVDVDIPTWSAYFRALEDVPPVLLEAAVDRALKTGGSFLPKPGELRQMAEDARKALITAHPFQPCGRCSAQGWCEVEYDGVKRMTRCDCWQRHHMRMLDLVGELAPLMLPTALDTRYERDEIDA